MTDSTKLVLKHTCIGIFSGIINVFVFNPFDRALNLATKNQTTIFKHDYWKIRYIYQGVHHGVIQRTFSYGLYYPLVDIIDTHANNKILASCITSGCIGLVTSPISSAKQQYWNSNQTVKPIQFALNMYKIGGPKSFFRGTYVTMQRDILFGMTLGYLSSNYNKDKIFVLDSIFATCAAIVSSPFNYIRVMKYKTECDTYVSSLTIINNLFETIKLERGSSSNNLFKQIIFTFYSKFNVGWGSLRVGIGMAFSRQLYETMKLWI